MWGRLGAGVKAVTPNIPVGALIAGAFGLARGKHPELNKTWIAISFQIGSLLPNSLLVSSLQRVGELDLVLRCMEDDFQPPKEDEPEQFHTHYQLMLSEIWIGAIYEIFRLLIARELAPHDDVWLSIKRDLELLRMPIDKHELAGDNKLSEPLLMQKTPPNGDNTDNYSYSKKDPKKAHIMPISISDNGSATWLVTNLKTKSSYWIGRRDISERIVALRETPPTE